MADDLNFHITDTGMRPMPGAVLAIVLLASVLVTAGCSSGGKGESTDSPDTAVVSPAADSSTDQPAEPATNDTPAENSTTEMTPVALLLEEIRLVGVGAIRSISGKLNAGQALTDIETACLAGFDPALGQTLTSIDCSPSGISVGGSDIDAGDNAGNDSGLQVMSAALLDDNSCNNSLAEGEGTDCQLLHAEMLLPVVWVPIEGAAASQIASITPLQGANIQFNKDGDNRLQLESVSDLFVPYSCSIEISTAAIIDEGNLDDCQSQVNRLIGRLYSARTGS